MNIETKAKELAESVLAMSEVCDRSKLDDLELEKLEIVVKAARTMFVDQGEIKVVK